MTLTRDRDRMLHPVRVSGLLLHGGGGQGESQQKCQQGISGAIHQHQREVTHMSSFSSKDVILFNSDTARWRGQPLISRPPLASHLWAPPRPEVGLIRSSVVRRPRRRLNRWLWRHHHSHRRMRSKMSTPTSLRVLMEYPILTILKMIESQEPLGITFSQRI